MLTTETYALLADATAAVHFLYVLFVVLAQAYIMVGWLFFWRFTRSLRFRIVHLVMMLIVSIQEMLGLRCPLTVLESHFRRQAGQVINENTTFLMEIVRRTMFFALPDWMFTFMYVGFGVLVALTFLAMPPQKIRDESLDALTEGKKR